MKKILNYIFGRNNKINKFNNLKLEQKYISIANTIDIDLLNYKTKNIKIESISNNLYNYLKNIEMLLEHDYVTHIPKNIEMRVKYKFKISNWIIDEENYIHDNVNSLFKQFITYIADINRIYDLIKNNNNPVDEYNSMVLKIYIINMCKIVDSVTQHV